MIFWVLTVGMLHGSVEHGYKFVEKKNCENVGEFYLKLLRHGSYKCKKKNIKLTRNIN